jgi:hypothetical protein
MSVLPFGDRGCVSHSDAHCAGPGDMRCMSRGSHGDSRVAAVGCPCEPGHLSFVADLFLYIDMWGLSRDVVAPERVWIHRALASFK